MGSIGCTALIYDIASKTACRCRIWNQSATGWEVWLPEGHGATGAGPWFIDLERAVAYDVEVIWREGRRVGLKSGSMASLDQKRIAYLWEQVVNGVENLDPVLL